MFVKVNCSLSHQPKTMSLRGGALASTRQSPASMLIKRLRLVTLYWRFPRSLRSLGMTGWMVYRTVNYNLFSSMINHLRIILVYIMSLFVICHRSRRHNFSTLSTAFSTGENGKPLAKPWVCKGFLHSLHNFAPTCGETSVNITPSIPVWRQIPARTFPVPFPGGIPPGGSYAPGHKHTPAGAADPPGLH